MRSFSGTHVRPGGETMSYRADYAQLGTLIAWEAVLTLPSTPRTMLRGQLAMREPESTLSSRIAAEIAKAIERRLGPAG